MKPIPIPDQLSIAGIPYGIRKNGTVFVMAGNDVMNVKGMTLERIRRARAEQTERRDAAFDRIDRLSGYADRPGSGQSRHLVA